MIDPAVLARVPGCEDGRPPRVQRPLPGGRGCNDIRYLETGAGRFVLRTRLAPLQRPGADPLRELACHRAAAAADLAPRVLAAAPDGGWILMEWLDGRLWREADLADAAAIDHLGQRLARLHALAVPAGAPFDALDYARAQQRLIHEQWPQRAAEAARQVESLYGELAAPTGPPIRAAICHGDLQMANCIGDPLRFVDWEYAQIADPAYDLACLLTYYPQLQPHLQRLLAAAGLAGPDDQARVAAQCRLFAILNRLWALAHLTDAG
ncbi:MAG: aminoglycoside phosphotransferase family protein [Steroidobacteraceae bacterium]